MLVLNQTILDRVAGLVSPIDQDSAVAELAEAIEAEDSLLKQLLGQPLRQRVQLYCCVSLPAWVLGWAYYL